MVAMRTRFRLLLAVVALLSSGFYEAAFGLPMPSDLEISVVNFYTTLTWVPHKDTPEGTQYTVEYSTNKIWSNVIGCSNVTSTHCDLTKETAENYADFYNIQLRAVHSTGVSKWIKRRITPLNECVIGDPEVYVNVFGNNVTVFTIPPQTPIFIDGKQQSINDLLSSNVLYVFSLGSIEYQQNGQIDKAFTMRLGDGVRFCASAKIQLATFVKESNWSRKVCIKTKTDNFWTLVIVSVLLALITSITGIIICKVHKYLNKFKISTPTTLGGVMEHHVSQTNPNRVFSGQSDGNLDGITIDYNPGLCLGNSADLNQLFSIKLNGEDGFNARDIPLKDTNDRQTTYSSVSPISMCKEMCDRHIFINRALDDSPSPQDPSNQRELNVVQSVEFSELGQYSQSRPLLTHRETPLSTVGEQWDMAYRCQQGVPPYMSQ